MGEIKSTLDLVMEKTKNLNLSDEEKQDQKDKEIESRLRGLLQKFQDRLITSEKFKTDYQNLRAELKFSGEQNEHLLRVLCARIELDRDNQALLELLLQYADSGAGEISSVLLEFDSAVQAAAGSHAQIAKDHLADAHFIYGSAVVPNLDNDEAWREKVGEIRNRFDELLDAAKARIVLQP